MPRAPIKVICVTDYYLPGFKGGGPIRTIANMRKLLSDQVEIAVFTRDRDLGANAPYREVRVNEWLERPEGPIFYACPNSFNAEGLKRALADRAFDVLYLNSFFGFRSSIQILLAFGRKKPVARILLAPRGEFSGGALSIKWLKKRIYLWVASIARFYSGVHWHASTEMEKTDILAQFPKAEKRVYLAKDPIDIGGDELMNATPKPAGVARIAFISRISPMKNLDGLLRILTHVNCRVDLEIFGPVEDDAHWRLCQRLIEALPENVSALYKGSVKPEEVSRVFSGFDHFVFPTHGENFGHVIFEALRAGTPVLVSDQTPWKTDQSGAITALALADTAAWAGAIEQIAARTQQEQAALRAATLEYARGYARDRETKNQNIAMFKDLASYDFQ